MNNLIILETLSKSIKESYDYLEVDSYFEEVKNFINQGNKTQEELYNFMILQALGRLAGQELNDIIGLELKDWNCVARDVLRHKIYSEVSERSFRVKISQGVQLGLYDTSLDSYGEDELAGILQNLNSSRDSLFDYAGLKSLYDRYLLRDTAGNLLETPQERFMVIALHLMSVEDSKDSTRASKVIMMYEALSNLLLTVATPTLANAGKPKAQLASCQILTTEDSLRGIFDDLTDVSSFSKHGAGIGIYIGKLRATASDIRGNKGVSSGVIPWVKGLDNTAVSVNQLGVRNGAISVWLDIWHRDVFDFIDLRLNTGDQSKRAHNVFPGLSIPDIFWRRVQERGTFTLFDPHEVKTVMGYSLEDCYDEALYVEGVISPILNKFTYRYTACEEAAKKGLLNNVKTVPALDIVKSILKASLETGIPFTMNRDTVNRTNPNSHAGMIYSSNLCTEVLQNQSPSYVVLEDFDHNGVSTIKKVLGDLVTCNLSSLVLNRIKKYSLANNMEFLDTLRNVIYIQMRALDNVVTLNTLPVPAATYTNRRYRSVGAGQQGIAALLAMEGIDWDSEESVTYIGELQKNIHAFSIRASADLALERGSYPLYAGSDWATGAYFDKRNDGDRDYWDSLKQYVQTRGMRNAYLFAIAPTGSTGVIAGSTPSIDPVFDYVYYEKKKNFVIPVLLPDLSFETLPFYKPTGAMKYEGDIELAQMWAIKQNEIRSKYIDQGSSFNLYVNDEIKAKSLLRIHIECWQRGIKTTYYTRVATKPMVTADCVSCSA